MIATALVTYLITIIFKQLLASCHAYFIPSFCPAKTDVSDVLSGQRARHVDSSHKFDDF